MNLQKIFDDTDFVHTSGTKEELQVAEYLKAQCEALGAKTHIEGFRVPMGDIEETHLYADGEEIECRACQCCGSGSVEGELYYMPGTDPVSIAGATDKIVLLDTAGVTHFVYQDLMKAGAKALLFQYGNSTIRMPTSIRETCVRLSSETAKRCSVRRSIPVRLFVW